MSSSTVSPSITTNVTFDLPPVVSLVSLNLLAYLISLKSNATFSLYPIVSLVSFFTFLGLFDKFKVIY